MEINYEGTWQRVLEKGWTDNNSNTVCSYLKCGEGRSFGPSPLNTWLGKVLRTVTCPPNAVDISDCTITKLNTPPVGQQAVMLICEGECLLNVSILSFKVLSFCTLDLQPVDRQSVDYGYIH